MPEYLDPEIANEGQSANNWQPGAWTNSTPVSEDEFQPDIEPPHIPDYAMLKKHKNYAKYFRPYRYQPFPAFVYHQTMGERIVRSKEEAQTLGADWTRFVPVWFHQTFGRKVMKSEAEVSELGLGWAPGRFSENDKVWVSARDMGGKALPIKTDTQRLTEALVAGLTQKKDANFDPTAIAAIVSAVMSAIPQPQPLQSKAPKAEDLMPPELAPVPVKTVDPLDAMLERTALLELAEKEGVKIDGRWSVERIKKELGLV